MIATHARVEVFARGGAIDGVRAFEGVGVRDVALVRTTAARMCSASQLGAPHGGADHVFLDGCCALVAHIAMMRV